MSRTSTTKHDGRRTKPETDAAMIAINGLYNKRTARRMSKRLTETMVGGRSAVLRQGAVTFVTCADVKIEGY